MRSYEPFCGWSAAWSTRSSLARRLAEPQWVLGLMSGTSLDGVDACLLRLSLEGMDAPESARLVWQDLRHHFQPYPEALVDALLAVQQGKPVVPAELALLNDQLATLYAEAVQALLAQAACPKEAIFALGVHGQTIYHQPPTAQNPLGQTWQLGNAALLGALTGVPALSDFRSADMAVGGQGAPLVPLADCLLFGENGSATCMQNLGGIGNVTLIPPNDSNWPPLAFDTGPANMLLDMAARFWLQTPYDKNGEHARQGQVHLQALAWLQEHPFFQEAPPRSTGRDAFGAPYFEAFRASFPQLRAADALATLTELTVWSIADSYARYITPRVAVNRVVLGGGGTRNAYLVERLRQALPDALAHGKPAQAVRVSTHQEVLGLSDTVKEAFAFAVLAWTSRLGLPNNVPSCTGARRSVVLGCQQLAL